MAKSNKSSASTWRKLDAAYRAEQKKRRDANKSRRLAREDSGFLADAGFDPADLDGADTA